MVGRVDFNKTVEYWQQDKWISCFPIKWHIVKDIPNSSLKHIILEYNENNQLQTTEIRKSWVKFLSVFLLFFQFSPLIVDGNTL